MISYSAPVARKGHYNIFFLLRLSRDNFSKKIIVMSLTGHRMMYYSAASSSLNKKKTDLKGILSDGLCFSMERRVIFLLRNVKCKDYVSCQVVEKTHLRLICVRRMKSRSSSTRKKTKKKRLLSFLHMFSKVQHLKGLMTVSDN